ncbi:calbindin-32 isoform X1 [Strongylocentrotus purpuratus]|uniref:EF-hand domain-containing protein n=1 Tax=Strongylocentrotus purpuratus TaxID=7668 RepID=A0A7M7SU90_STRPU|nr:calbindin-32 isoform X1 [Strongylocentrotus purpuratus]
MMARYDQNKDGKIEMRELAEILPPEESFLVLFRSQQPLSSIEFMEIWRRFDSDSSGFIEVNELKSFMKHLITKNQLGDISDDKLDEYAKSILKLFDANNDGKLELKEMAKLLPTKENFLKQFQKITGQSGASQGKGILGQKTLTRSEFERVFSYYDKDKNGTIEGDELNGFLKDLMEHEGNEKRLKRIPTDSEIAALATQIMKSCDSDGDGVLSVDELHRVICRT